MVLWALEASIKTFFTLDETKSLKLESDMI